MNIRNQKGINMITLSIAVIILVIITSILVYNAKDGVKVKTLNNLYNDIEQLNNKVSSYYVEHGDIPKSAKYENLDFLNTAESNQINPNNGSDFYVINLKALEGVSLNYGRGFDSISPTDTTVVAIDDIYIINEVSHTIYYPRGIEVQGTRFYTEPDNWTSVDLSIIPIYTAEQLAKVGTGENVNVNGVNFTFSLDGNYVLKNDIDLSSVCSETSGTSWTPIGKGKGEFSGKFYGNGHEVQNLYINSNALPVGLFSFTKDATIKDLGITGKVYADMETESSTKYAGGMIGIAFGSLRLERCYSNALVDTKSSISATGGLIGGAADNSIIDIYDCYNNGNVVGKLTGGLIGFKGKEQRINIIRSYNLGNISSSNAGGGILGYIQSNTNATLTDCYNNGEITNSGNVGTGGIVGYQNKGGTLTITNCENNKKVTGYVKVGGIAGMINSGTIEKSGNSGQIEGSAVNDTGGAVGGIIGWCNSNGITQMCKNTGSIIGKSNCIGGICGVNDGGTIEKCFNNGNVDSTGTNATAGVTGYHKHNNSKTMNCYNNGSINGKNGVAGIVGYLSYGAVSNCYNTGSLSGTTDQVKSVAAAVSTTTGATETNCFYLSTLSTTDDYATAKTEAEMKAQAFVDLLNAEQSDAPWQLDTNINQGYPIFKWQLEE